MYNSDSNVMKRIVIGFVCPLIGALLMTSCLKDDDEMVKSSEVALLTFGIKDLKTVHTIQKDNGEDSTYTTVMSGSIVEFSIDQVGNRVYNSDSIAYGTNVKRVQVKVTADGYVYYVKQNGELGSIEDSIDFTSPVTFRVKSYDEQYTRDYLVSINVHQVDPKKTVWVQLKNTNYPEFVKQKAFVKGDSLFVIGKSADGTYCTASAATIDATNWETTACSGIEGTGFSALFVEGVFYLKTDAGLYRSKDAIVWDIVDIAEMPALPTEESINGAVAWFDLPLSTNKDIIRSIFVTTPETADTCALVWTKLSTQPQWIEIGSNGNRIYSCPNLENLAVIQYADKMYAFGGKSVGNRKIPLEAFSDCYESRDNGVTWKSGNKKSIASFSLPEEFKSRNEAFSTTTDGEYVWIMWSNGEVWRGRWNGIK